MTVAAVDAVRNRDEGPPPAETTSELEDREELAERLAALGARGELVLFGAGCAPKRVALPSLERSESADGCLPLGVESPDGGRIARCLSERTEVFASSGSLDRFVPGCVPAWRPDGTLTVALDRSVVGVRECGARRPVCTEPLIPRTELERAARRHPSVPRGPMRLRALIDGIAWVSSTTAAVQLSIRAGGRLGGLGALSAIAFFENGRLSRAQPYYRVTGGRIAASPLGSYVSMAPDVILRSDGSQVTLPEHLRESHAFAWSGDERFLALATPHAVHVLDVASLERYDTTGSALRSVTLPVSAEELSWR